MCSDRKVNLRKIKFKTWKIETTIYSHAAKNVELYLILIKL